MSYTGARVFPSHKKPKSLWAPVSVGSLLCHSLLGMSSQQAQQKAQPGTDSPSRTCRRRHRPLSREGSCCQWKQDFTISVLSTDINRHRHSYSCCLKFQTHQIKCRRVTFLILAEYVADVCLSWGQFSGDDSLYTWRKTNGFYKQLKTARWTI